MPAACARSAAAREAEGDDASRAGLRRQLQRFRQQPVEMVGEQGLALLPCREEAGIHPAQIGARRLPVGKRKLEQAGRQRRDLDAELTHRANEPVARMGGQPRHAFAIGAAQLEMADAPFEAELEGRLGIARKLVGDDADDHVFVFQLGAGLED